MISTVQYAVAHTGSCAVISRAAQVRLRVENEQLRQHVVLLTEEISIKDGRDTVPLKYRWTNTADRVFGRDALLSTPVRASHLHLLE